MDSQAADIPPILTSLQKFGIFVGDPVQRLELAQRLLKDGLKPADVDYLLRAAAETASSRVQTAKLFMTWVKDADSVRLVLNDLKLTEETYKEVQQAKQPAPKKEPQPYPGQSYWKQPGQKIDSSDATWERRRKAQMVFCIVFADRKSFEYAAEVVGVDVPTAKSLYEEGKAIQGWKPPVKINPGKINWNRKPKDSEVPDKTPQQIKDEYRKRLKSKDQ